MGFFSNLFKRTEKQEEVKHEVSTDVLRKCLVHERQLQLIAAEASEDPAWVAAMFCANAGADMRRNIVTGEPLPAVKDRHALQVKAVSMHRGVALTPKENAYLEVFA